MYHFDFSLMQIDTETKKQTKSFDVKCDNSQGMQKVTKKWKEPSFLKTLLLGFDKF